MTADGPGRRVDPEQLRAVVAAATRAPSIHNTQPWRFVAGQGSLDLYADRDRVLPVIDPTGRQLTISCGSALLFARLAVRALGYAEQTTLLPDPGDADHLARLLVGAPSAPSELERRLAAAIPARHTHREPFEDRPVPVAVLDALHGAANAEGAWLKVIDAADDKVATAVLLSHADTLEGLDPAYRAELERWVRPDDTAADGVPRSAAPSTSGDRRRSSFMLRDFDVGGMAPAKTSAEAAAVPSDDEAGPPPVERPLVVVLGTPRDSPQGWLQAGAALGRVLLRATVEGLAASPLNQVLDVPALREVFRRDLRLVGFPQMLLRMGYGGDAPASPRRPVQEVLDPEG